jgi:hypothetical protein
LTKHRGGPRATPRASSVPPNPPSNSLLLVPVERVHPGDVLQERIGMTDPESDVEEHLARGDAPWPAASLPHEESHLLVARPPNALLFSGFADCAADFGCAVRLRGEPVDLVPKPVRNPRREESHDETVPGELPHVCDRSVPKPCPCNRLLLGGQAVGGRSGSHCRDGDRDLRLDDLQLHVAGKQPEQLAACEELDSLP